MAVLADDLIWSTRIASFVREAGADPDVVRSAGSLVAALEAQARGPRLAVVDLTARAYDPVAAVAAAHAAGARVLAVGQHDLVEQRRAARAAGAVRVLAYRQLAEDGTRILGSWLAGNGGGSRA